MAVAAPLEDEDAAGLAVLAGAVHPAALDARPVAAGYPRQSRARAADIASGRVVSADLQLRGMEAFAHSRGWAFDAELSRQAADLNVSGARKESDRRHGRASWKKRRGLMLLLDAAEQGRFRHLIVYKLSRLARSAVEALDIIEGFMARGVAVHVADMGVSTDNPMGRMLLTILAAVAEMDLENIREFARDSARERAEGGKHHGPTPAWIGREPDPDAPPPSDPAAPRPTRYCLAEPFASTVRRLVRLRAGEGASYTDIAAALNREGRPAAEGGFWDAQLVYLYLRPEYVARMRGTAIFGADFPAGDPRRIETPGVFPPLLTSEEADELEATQRALGALRSPVGPDGEPVDNSGRRAVVATEYLLTGGLAVCAECGAPLVSMSGSGGQRNYACRHGRTRPEEHPAQRERSKGGLSVSAPALEEAAVRAVVEVVRRHGDRLLADLEKSFRQQREQQQHPKRGRPTKEEAARRAAEAAGEAPARVPRPKRTREELDAAEANLLDAVEAGAMKAAQVAPRMQAITDERRQWELYEAQEAGELDALLGWQTIAKLAGKGQGEGGAAGEGAPAPAVAPPPSVSRSELRLALRRILASVETPVIFPGVYAVHAARNPQRWARLRLSRPLPDGTTVVLSGIYTERFAGERRVEFGDGAPANRPHRAGVKAHGSRSFARPEKPRRAKKSAGAAG